MANRNFNAEFWEIVWWNETDERDPIELAATDFRTVNAACFILFSKDDGNAEKIQDYSELCNMVGGEYYLSRAEMGAVMEISEDRLMRDSKNG